MWLRIILLVKEKLKRSPLIIFILAFGKIHMVRRINKPYFCVRFNIIITILTFFRLALICAFSLHLPIFLTCRPLLNFLKSLHCHCATVGLQKFGFHSNIIHGSFIYFLCPRKPCIEIELIKYLGIKDIFKSFFSLLFHSLAWIMGERTMISCIPIMCQTKGWICVRSEIDMIVTLTLGKVKYATLRQYSKNTLISSVQWLSIYVHVIVA